MDHTPLDCCDYLSTAFQIHIADNDDDDGADSIVGVKGSTNFFFFRNISLIREGGLSIPKLYVIF